MRYECTPADFHKYLFTSSAQRLRSDDAYIRLHSNYRIDTLVRIILSVTTVALLVGPSAILFLVPGHSTLKILLVMLFSLLFSVMLSACTKAKRHEIFAATAT